MDPETFLTPGRLVELTGITPKRLEQQVQRHGADPDAPADARALPISKAEPGRHPRYTFADALMIACAIQLERCGVDFTQAVRFTKLARLSAFITSGSDEGDLWFAAWSDESSATDGEAVTQQHTVFGSFRNVSRRLPADRFATISLNVSQVARQLEAKLRALGIERNGFRLVERGSLGNVARILSNVMTDPNFANCGPYSASFVALHRSAVAASEWGSTFAGADRAQQAARSA